MSRAIKFRAWSGEAMEYGGFAVHASGAIVDILPVLSRVTKQSPIMQFTGLTDCNGAEIFEGDLLNVFYTSGDGEHIHDCIYAACIGVLGIEFRFKALLWESHGWNQYPISTTLCERYDTLALVSDGLVVPDKYGRNAIYDHSWKENDRSNYFKVIGNIYEHPHLLDHSSESP